jgi:hypothetical protein
MMGLTFFETINPTVKGEHCLVDRFSVLPDDTLIKWVKQWISSFPSLFISESLLTQELNF